MRRRLQSSLVLAFLILVVTSCGTIDEMAAQPPTDQTPTEPDPTDTIAPPSRTPTLTNTPAPTATPTPLIYTPAPSDTPAPTNTSTPSDTVTPSDTPYPTKTPVPPTATIPPPTKTPAPSPTPVPPQPPQGRVVIAKVYNQSYTEYVEIANRGSGPADMSGWAVTGSKGDETYQFPPGYTLAAAASMRLHSGDGGTHNPPSDIKWTDKTVWNNKGETVYLKNAQGGLVHKFSY